MSEDLLSSRHIARYRYSNEDKWGGPCLYTTYIWDRETSSQYTNKTSNKASTTESLGAHQNIMVRKKVTFEKTWWMKKNPLCESVRTEEPACAKALKWESLRSPSTENRPVCPQHVRERRWPEIELEVAETNRTQLLDATTRSGIYSTCKGKH